MDRSFVTKINIEPIKQIINSRSIYFALFMFLWFKMCLHPFLGAFVGASAYFVKKEYLRVPLLIFPFVMIHIHYQDIWTFLLLAIPSVIGIVITELSLQKLDEERIKNNLKILVFSMAAIIIADFSIGHAIRGIYYAYFALWYSNSMFRIFNVFILAETINILNLVTNKIKGCAFVIFNIFFCLGIVNYWVTEITNKSFVLSDIYNATAAMNVMEGVQVTSSAIISFIVFLLAIIAFNVALYKTKFSQIEFSKRLKSGIKAFIAMAVMLFILLGNVVTISIFESVVNYGLISHLAINARSVAEPADYDNFIKEYSLEETAVTKKSDGPNIIVVMSEAFSDLSVLGELDTNVDYMPNIRKIMNENPSGILYSSVIGNNTCSSEYEFLTGVPTAFTDRGSVIYQKHIKENTPSIVSLLEDQGYVTAGLHPYNASGYNRLHAWEGFGFDKTYFEADFEGATKIRDFVDDKSFYNKIIEVFENKGENPLFCFGISMQNHATYLTDYKDEVKLNNMDFEEVNEYLSLIKVTDEETHKLINYFEEVDEDTMIVFFGDHQPMVSDEFYTAMLGEGLFNLDPNKGNVAYKIPYFIWTNYDTDIEAPAEMSMNFLTNVVLEAAGLEKSSWFNFTDTVLEKYPVISDQFITKNGQFIGKDIFTEELSKISIEDKDHPLYILKQMQVLSYKKTFEE